MIPTELLLRNFMCYRNDLEPLRFDGLHIACLSGENGAGKSALLDAITWALWGKARMSDDELIAQGEQEMLVDLCFQINGQTYRVIRRRQRAKSGSRSAGKSSLEFQLLSDMGWRPLADGKIQETERRIEHLLHMKYETFINSAFLLQGRADEFTRKPPGERKQVLADILDLREYALLETRAKERARGFGDKVKALDGLIEHLEQEASKVAGYTDLVAEASTRVSEVSAALIQAEADHQAALATLQALEAQQARRRQVQEELSRSVAEQQRQEQEMAVLHQRISEAEALLQREAEIQAGMAALMDARTAQKRLDDIQPRFQALEDQRREYQEQLKEEKRTLLSERDRLQDAVDALSGKLTRRAELTSALADLQQRLDALTSVGEELQHVRAALDTCEQQSTQAHTLLRQRGDLANQIKMRQDSLVGVREEQQRVIDSRIRDMGDLQQWRTDLEQAQSQQQALLHLSEQLAALQQQERVTSEQVGELRAYCAQFKQQADQIKKDRDRLNGADTSVCPVCQSELGQEGIAGILDHYTQEIDTLRQRYRDGQSEAKELETHLADLRAELTSISASVAEARSGAARVELLQHQLAQAETWQAELQRAQVSLADVQRQIDTEDFEPEARAAIRSIDTELAQLEHAIAEQKLAESSSARRKPDAQVPILDRLSHQRTTLRTRQAALEQQLEARTRLLSQIDTCQRDLADLEQAAAELPAAEQRVATLTVRIDQGDFGHDIRVAGRAIVAEQEALGYTQELHLAARNQVEQLNHWADEERRLGEARIRLDSDQRMLQQASELHTRRAADIERLTSEDQHLEQELRALPEGRQRATSCKQTLDARRSALDAATRDLHEKQSLLNRAREASQQLVEKQQERTTLAERQGVFHELAEAFGKKGVQAMLIETAIPDIERESNRLLGRMTDNQMHVTFEMQRDTKKGDTVETLDIKIADALGTRTYDAFSGGEAMRVNFAIRVALARLLARRAGASLETLVIDEGFGVLDAQGRERFVEAITGVQHDFRRILIVTHLEELKERFPVQIEITKTPDGSRWRLV